MSERIDRRIGNGGLLLATTVIILILAAGAGGYVWLRMSALSEAPALPPAPPAPAQPARADEPLSITLFVPAGNGLAQGVTGIKRQPDVQGQAREALTGLQGDVRAAQAPVLKDIRLRAFFFDTAGTGYVDLAPAAQGGIKASAGEELLAIYAIVNLLTQNFEEIKQVRFLLDGREAQTLAGHIDLSGKFTKRMDLVKQ